jgi:hypothetical protein
MDKVQKNNYTRVAPSSETFKLTSIHCLPKARGQFYINANSSKCVGRYIIQSVPDAIIMTQEKGILTCD